ncbi:MAG: hypothetical protein EBV14_03075, partial [Actinobacteria bacterium]|nr:hypothetical protein [Actinomycetota bacterium]
MLDTPTRVVVVQFPHWSSFAFALGRSARSAFEPIVRAVVAHAPLVEVTAPGVIVFATRGPSRYVGGDESLAALVHSAVGDAVRATAGDTAGATIGSAFDAQRSHAAFGVGIADGRLAA